MDHTVYRVVGKRGSGMSRVEWTFTPDDNEHTCSMVSTIYGTSGRDPIVTSPAITIPETAAIAAAQYLKGHPDRTVVLHEPKAYH